MTKTFLGTGLLCLCVAFTACGDDGDDSDGAGATSGEGGGAGEATSGGGVGATGGEGGAGGAGGIGEPGATIELRGRWKGEFGGEIIDDDVWGESALIEFSNDDNLAITQNADDAEYSPSKFNRIVWTEVSMASFYYCTTDFGLDSLLAARAANGAADSSNPDEGGCGEGDFPWTKLTSDDIEIFGRWANEYGGFETIDALTWKIESSSGTSVSRVIEFSNEDDEVITQNADDAEYSPSKFNRIVWTQLEGNLYYCTTDFELDTLEDAQDADTEADATTPAESGCGGFAWTKLTYAP